MHTDTFTKVLDPSDTSTGGGSASALAGGMAGALIDLVCHLTLKDESINERRFLDKSGKKAGQLSNDLLAGADDDRAAFQAVRDAYRLPKETDEQRSGRSNAVQAAWVNAAWIPLKNADKCAELAALVCELNGKTNPNAQSDLMCAFFLARAGCLGCLENVAINLLSIKDQEKAAVIRQQADQIGKRLAILNDLSEDK